jgi:hypothetical protein
MKVAVVSESPHDEELLRVFARALLGREIEVVQARARSGGVDAVFNALPAILRANYYHSDVAGLIVVVDSDTTDMHLPGHASTSTETDCRYCRLQGIVAQTLGRLSPLQPPRSLETALGLAVPCVEAWLLSCEDHNIHETAWFNGVRAGKFPYSAIELKHRLYRDVRAPIAEKMARVRECMERITQGDGLSRLENKFPHGFGLLAQALRSWRTE